MSNTPEEAIRNAINTIFISATELIVALPKQSSNMFGMEESAAKSIVADETIKLSNLLLDVMEKMKNERPSS